MGFNLVNSHNNFEKTDLNKLRSLEMVLSLGKKISSYLTVLSFSLLSNVLMAEGSLHFQLNEKREVQEAASFEGMPFASDPETFIGKDIVSIVPLSDADRTRVLEAFEEAAKNKVIVNVDYTLDGKTFLAEITPLKYSFAVKVWDVEDLED